MGPLLKTVGLVSLFTLSLTAFAKVDESLTLDKLPIGTKLTFNEKIVFTAGADKVTIAESEIKGEVYEQATYDWDFCTVHSPKSYEIREIAPRTTFTVAMATASKFDSEVFLTLLDSDITLSCIGRLKKGESTKRMVPTINIFLNQIDEVISVEY